MYLDPFLHMYVVCREVVSVHNCFLQVELLYNSSISLFSHVDGTEHREKYINLHKKEIGSTW